MHSFAIRHLDRSTACCVRARYAALLIPLRRFQTLKRGYDAQQRTLFDKLGFGAESESVRASRTRKDLEQGLVLESLRLTETAAASMTSPAAATADAVGSTLGELRAAYAALQNDSFRDNYATHPMSSNDVKLHVLLDGDHISANYNPEHQSFAFVDHAAPSRAESLTDVQDVFRLATGLSAREARPYAAAALRAPQNGSDITVSLRICFEESLRGCTRQIRVRRDVRCAGCDGTGLQKLRVARKCPQCFGRGRVHLPSATYHCERTCQYCNGEGVRPAPRCPRCNGRGVEPGQVAELPVVIPPHRGTAEKEAMLFTFRLPHKGHAGARGGMAGDVVVTVLVAEHRYFYHDGAHLHAMLPLPLATAMLGGVVMVPTLDGGRAALHVPPCVYNGQVLVLPRGDQAGAQGGTPDLPQLLFHALIVIPKENELTGQQKGALRRYEAASGEAEEGAGQCGRCADDEAAWSVACGSALEAQCAALKTQYKHWLTSSV